MSDPSLLTALGYLQEIIKRMATNSLLLKGWSMSLTGVIIAISKKDAGNDYLAQLWLSVIFFNILFSILDAYYLKQERICRNEYNNKIGKLNNSIEKDNLTLVSTEIVKSSFFSSYFSISVFPFYGLIILFIFLLARGCL